MPHSIPGPAYRIHTARLVIRCWNPADAPLLKAAVDASLDHLRPWMPWAENEPQELDKKIDGLRYDDLDAAGDRVSRQPGGPRRDRSV